MKNKKVTVIFFYLTSALFLIDWTLIYSVYYWNYTNGWAFSFVITFLTFISFFVFILLSHDKKRNFIMGLIIFLPAIFLARQKALQAVPFAVIAMLLYWTAINQRIKKEQLSRIKLEPYRVLKRGRPFFLIAVGLMIAAGFYFSMINNQQLKDAPRFEIQVPNFVGSIVVRVMNLLTPQQNIDGSTTIDQIIEDSFEQQYQNEVEQNPSLGMIPITEEIKGQLIQQNREALADQLSIELNGNETISQMVSLFLTKWINDFVNVQVDNSKAVPIGTSIALGLTLYTVMWILSFLQFGLAWGVLTVLARKDKIELTNETMEVERIA